MRNRRPPGIDRLGAPFDLAADEVLYRQGEPAQSLYYLESGAVAITARAVDGQSALIDVQGAGSYVGARSLGEEKHATTAMALVPSVAVRLPKREARHLLATDSGFAEHFARCMMRRMASLEEAQVDRAINPTRKRLARMLLILAGLDTDSDGDDGASVLERISDDMLAQMLDANPGCIRQLLHEFRRAGHLGCGEALAVHSSLAKVLLPTQLASDSR